MRLASVPILLRLPMRSVVMLSSDVEANGKEDEAQPRAEGENASVCPTIATARNKERGDRRRYEDMVPTIWQQLAMGGAAPAR